MGTIFDAHLTFSNTPDPFYSIGARVFDNYGAEKWVAQNITFNVGNHPFFLVPSIYQLPAHHRGWIEIWRKQKRRFLWFV